MRPMIALAALCLLFTAIPAMADERADLGLPPEGHTLVNLSATENKTLKQDLLVASMRIEVKNDSNMTVQKTINETMAKALALVKKYDTLKIETGGYSLYEHHEPIIDSKTGKVNGHEKQWRGAQTLTIKSVDSESVLKATGQVQELGFVMNNLQYTLAPETAEKERDALVVLALKKLKTKAAVIAQALDKSGYELADVSVDSAMPHPPMPYARGMMKMEMAADTAMAAPSAEAGESTVSLTVNARVLLTP